MYLDELDPLMAEMPQMTMELDSMMMALLLAANVIALVAISIMVVYGIGLAAMALSEKWQQIPRPSLPKLAAGQMKASAVRTVLQ